MIVIDAKALQKHTRALATIEKGVPRALSAAMNRTVRQGRTEVSRQTRAIYLITQAKLYATLTIKNAGAGDLSAEIRSRHSGMLPLYDFKVSPKRPGGRRRPVHASVKKSGGGTLGRAFIADMGGHTGVFARTTSSRLPVRELRTISAPIMVGQPEVAEPAIETMQEVFARRMDHEASRLLASGHSG
jgi:hypothetical protein